MRDKTYAQVSAIAPRANQLRAALVLRPTWISCVPVEPVLSACPDCACALLDRAHTILDYAHECACALLDRAHAILDYAHECACALLDRARKACFFLIYARARTCPRVYKEGKKIPKNGAPPKKSGGFFVSQPRPPSAVKKSPQSGF
nr:MAG TPA: hypothetical protein [Caudoviricetes sp.]